MFGIGASELLLIIGITLIIFGPEKLPEFASNFGKVMGSLKKHTNDLRREFYNSVYVPAESIKSELKKEALDLKSELTNTEQTETEKIDQNPKTKND
jgi:Tat protein translocase TatB subunit